VSQIENDLIDVRSRELRAKTDFENYRAAYEKAVGTLLDRHGVTLD
jgi:outer membrane protein TolC